MYAVALRFFPLQTADTWQNDLVVGRSSRGIGRLFFDRVRPTISYSSRRSHQSGERRPAAGTQLDGRIVVVATLRRDKCQTASIINEDSTGRSTDARRRPLRGEFWQDSNYIGRHWRTVLHDGQENNSLVIDRFWHANVLGSLKSASYSFDL